MELKKILSFATLWGGLSEESLDALAGIAMPKNCARNETLFREKEKGSAVYIIGKGSVALTKCGGDGKDVAIKTIGPGEVFAEVILFEKDVYPVTATALSQSLIFALPKKDFLDLLNKTSFRNDFIRLLIHKQRYLTERLKSMASSDVRERFLSYLKDHFDNQKRIIPNLTKKEMAAAIQTTPESLSRALTKLKAVGVLEWVGNEIHIKK